MSLPNPEFLARLEAEAGAESARLRRYALYEAYYDGEHADQVPSAKLQTLEKYFGFRANICDVVVDALAERLVVAGFTVTGPDAEAAALRVNEVWQRNRLDDDSAAVHTEAAMLGDAFVVVDWDRDAARPRVSYNPAGMISLGYADGGNRQLAYAVKRWDEGTRLRRKNIYFPDRIERYATTVNAAGQYAEAAWQPFTGDGQAAVIPWLDRRGRPLGIPVFAFRNKAKGRVYGRSELLNLIPLQDAINKTLVDLLLVLDSQGWPQRWVRGQAPAGGFQVGPGRVWTSNDPNFQAGELSQADPAGLLDSLMRLINIAAGRSRTPQYLFGMDAAYPSGESLKTADAGLAAKAADRQVSFGNVWEDVLAMALRLDATFGGAKWDVDALTVQTGWKSPELKNDLMLAQSISTLAPWLSDAQVLRETGKYTEQEIQRILDERRADKEAQNALGGALIDAFNRGGFTGTGDNQTGGNGSVPNATPGGQSQVRNPDRQ